MARIGGTLYVADIDRVVGFDLASGARLSVAELPGGDPSLANDLAAEPGGTLLVSDTLRNALYRLDPETGIWTLLTDGLPGANGIAIRPDGGIVVVGVGAGFAGIGLGMMTKYTIGVFVVGVVVGVLLTETRRYLRSPWLWGGVAVALLIFLPMILPPVLGLKPLPEGRIRDRLEANAKRIGFPQIVS